MNYYWPTDEYSIPADGLCLHVPPEPNRDHRCVREDGHKGKHEYVYAADGAFRPYSHKAKEPLHLVTASFYMAKERPRCDCCGKLTWNGASGDAFRWTNDKAKFEAAADRCQAKSL